MSVMQESIENYSASCRICNSICKRRDEVIAPCLCKHNRKWAHQSCIDRYRTTRISDTDFYRCSVCDSEYELKILLTDPKERLKCHIERQSKHVYNLLRDFLFAFLGLQGLVLMISYIIFFFDRSTSTLLNSINIFHLQSLDFYYFFGLYIVFSVIGFGVIIIIFLKFDVNSGMFGSGSMDPINVYLLITLDDILHHVRQSIYTSSNYLSICFAFFCSGDLGIIVASSLFIIALIIFPWILILILPWLMLKRHSAIVYRSLLVLDYPLVDRDPYQPLYLEEGVSNINPLLYINSPSTPTLNNKYSRIDRFNMDTEDDKHDNNNDNDELYTPVINPLNMDGILINEL